MFSFTSSNALFFIFIKRSLRIYKRRSIILFVGIFLDKKLHTEPLFTVIFLVFGVIGGFIGDYKLIKESSILKDDAGDKKHLS